MILVYRYRSCSLLFNFTLVAGRGLFSRLLSIFKTFVSFLRGIFPIIFACIVSFAVCFVFLFLPSITFPVLWRLENECWDSCGLKGNGSGSTGLNNVLRMSVTSLVYLSSPCAKHSGRVKFLQDHFIFDHPNSYLRMPTKEKFYEYVRNATHWKKCYVSQGSRKMFLTVPAKVFHCFDADRQ